MIPDGLMTQSQVVQINVKLPRDLVKKLDHYCVDADIYRAEAIERLLRQALFQPQTQSAQKPQPHILPPIEGLIGPRA